MSTGTKSILDDVLPDHESILNAPSLDDLQKQAERREVELDYICEQERKRRYKAIDAATGAVYLVQNPAVWLSNTKGYRRPEPEFQFNLADGRRFGARTGSKKAVATREAF